jgi:hypothetical protein
VRETPSTHTQTTSSDPSLTTSLLSFIEVLAIVTADGDALMNHKAYNDDPVVVKAAAQSSVDAMLWASDRLKSDKGVMMSAVSAHGRALRYTQTLRDDPSITLAAVTNDGDALQMASGSLRSDKAIVLAAVRQNPWALAYASEDLRADVDVVIEAVKGDKGAIKCAATEAVQHPRVVRALAAKGDDSGSNNSNSMFGLNWLGARRRSGSGEATGRGGFGTPPRQNAAELASPPNMRRGGPVSGR